VTMRRTSARAVHLKAPLRMSLHFIGRNLIPGAVIELRGTGDWCDSVYWPKSEQPAKRKQFVGRKMVEQGSDTAQLLWSLKDFYDDPRYSDDSQLYRTRGPSAAEIET
jgi:hypothetical protein